MSELAKAMGMLADLEAMRVRCRQVSPERLPTLDAATLYFSRVVAILSRHPNPSQWDLVLIEEYATKSNTLLQGFMGSVNRSATPPTATRSPS